MQRVQLFHGYFFLRYLVRILTLKYNTDCVTKIAMHVNDTREKVISVSFLSYQSDNIRVPRPWEKKIKERKKEKEKRARAASFRGDLLKRSKGPGESDFDDKDTAHTFRVTESSTSRSLR